MKISILLSISFLAACFFTYGQKPWILETTKQWDSALIKQKGVSIDEGEIRLQNKSGQATVRTPNFKKKRLVSSLLLRQSTSWQNWNAVPQVGPSNLQDAPVFLVKGPQDYWLFGRYGRINKQGKKFIAQDATLPGFDIPLKTTPHPNQFNAPGGLKRNLQGYNAWQSRDMINWVHHGSVTPAFARWTTTAEQVGGKTYIYYDFPNDQDPHLFIDDDLTDGLPGKNMGMAFADPSHGSDCAVIRDLDGKFHIIYEDYSPINASKHSWDSPLAGHSVSPNGMYPFKILQPAVDHRTKPTGKVGTYQHPHWTKEDPKRFPSNVAEYEIHEPVQNAYGDWAAICIGGQYYLFGDYHPAHKKIRTAWFTSSDINKPFEFCGEIGNGHPDPDIGFANGTFYLITQTNEDYVSPGPWVEKVETRVGVDKTGDGSIDQWTKWSEVKESYDYVPGFSKQVHREPAQLDISSLSAGHSFQVELRMTDKTNNASSPVLDGLELSFL